MLFGYLTLFTALIISLSSAVYSILGLTAIFASAFWPIVVLGGSLEFGKIVTTLWLHKYWNQAELQYKVYLSFAVAVLMLLTSMGVFGFLSKAHLDQAVPSGDVAAKVQIFDDKIKTQQDNIKAARAALTQMDAAVDQTMSRSTTEQGADKAANLRRSQARERTVLQNDISKAQAEITKLQEQRAPIASEMRKVEAEVGPIKYIAALIYGDNPEENVLEKAVRWVIILIVIVFDPLALTLLLAATKTFEWERGINILAPKKREEPAYEADDGALTDEQLDQIQTLAKKDLPTGEVISKTELFPVTDSEVPAPTNKKEQTLAGLDNIWNRTSGINKQDPEAEHAQLETPVPEKIVEHVVINNNEDENSPDKIAERVWKIENPNKTLKRERQMLRAGLSNQLPWLEPEFYSRAQLFNNLRADNTPQGPTGEVRGFGTQFPANPLKGDMFLRVDRLPSVLFKFNGANWIEVDKQLSDNYAYDDAYIDHLITKIDSGEYDPELLSDAERDHITDRLTRSTKQDD